MALKVAPAQMILCVQLGVVLVTIVMVGDVLLEIGGVVVFGMFHALKLVAVQQKILD